MPKSKSSTGDEKSHSTGGNPSTVWRGTLSFMLFSIPVSIHSASKQNNVSFHQLHNVCHGRINQKLYCGLCETDVARDDVLKGYEIVKDVHVIVTQDELDKFKAESAKTLDLIEFVPAKELDPVFFADNYFLAPEQAGHEAFSLIREAMIRRELVGIGKTIRRNVAHVCVIRPYLDGMMMHDLLWNDEVRTMAFPTLPAAGGKALEVTETLISTLQVNWDPQKYRNTYREDLLKMLHAKHAGEEITTEPEAKPTKAPVVDILSALQASLAAAKQRQGAA